MEGNTTKKTLTQIRVGGCVYLNQILYWDNEHDRIN